MIKVTAKPQTVFCTCSYSFHLMVPSSRFFHRPFSWRFVQRTSEGAGPQPAPWEEAPLLSRREAALLFLWALRQQGAVSHQVSRSQSIHVSRRGTGRCFTQTGESPAIYGLFINIPYSIEWVFFCFGYSNLFFLYIFASTVSFLYIVLWLNKNKNCKIEVIIFQNNFDYYTKLFKLKLKFGTLKYSITPDFKPVSPLKQQWWWM